MKSWADYPPVPSPSLLRDWLRPWDIASQWEVVFLPSLHVEDSCSCQAEPPGRCTPHCCCLGSVGGPPSACRGSGHAPQPRDARGWGWVSEHSPLWLLAVSCHLGEFPMVAPGAWQVMRGVWLWFDLILWPGLTEDRLHCELRRRHGWPSDRGADLLIKHFQDQCLHFLFVLKVFRTQTGDL